jgi:RHS repeat-associated protein
LTAVTNALNQPVHLGYDPVGNLTNIIDARNNGVGFAYDPLKRITNINYAAVSGETFQYDAVGKVTNYITRAGQTIQLAYNANNRLVQKSYANSGNVMTFGYDAASQLTNAVWAVGTVTNSALSFAYDAAGHLTNEMQQITTAPAHNVGYQYNAMGRRTRLTYPDGSFVTYQYNSNGWLTAILDGGTNVIVSYTYDAAGHRIGRALENSTFTVYNYDNAAQLTNILDYRQLVGVITNPVSQFQYGYDAAGNRLWVKRTNNIANVATAFIYNAVYSYDAINQLTNAQYGEMTNSDSQPISWNNNVTYKFDATGNRSSVVNASAGTTAYTANALNQYTNVGGATLTYDGNGNLTNDRMWSYTYDIENRLIKAVMGSTNIVYVYDALGRLVERDAPGGTNRFYFAGWQTIEERNGNDAVVRKYVYGPGIDEPVRMIYNGTKCYYHSDGLASIAEMTDIYGNNLELYGYDDYGNPTIMNGKGDLLSGSYYGNRLMFQGRDRDPDTGLYNFRNRYYSPSLGRFMQPDPARLAGGLNLYSSFYNNPVKYGDPMGFCTTDQVPNLMGPLPSVDPSDPFAPWNNPDYYNPFGDPLNPLSPYYEDPALNNENNNPLNQQQSQNQNNPFNIQMPRLGNNTINLTLGSTQIGGQNTATPGSLSSMLSNMGTGNGNIGTGFGPQVNINVGNFSAQFGGAISPTGSYGFGGNVGFSF